MIVVTKHQGLVDYLKEQQIINENTKIISHVSDPNKIRHEDVIGVLPLNLAVLTRTITEIPLSLAYEDRGQELSLERVREIAGDPIIYEVFLSNKNWR